MQNGETGNMSLPFLQVELFLDNFVYLLPRINAAKSGSVFDVYQPAHTDLKLILGPSKEKNLFSTLMKFYRKFSQCDIKKSLGLNRKKKLDKIKYLPSGTGWHNGYLYMKQNQQTEFKFQLGLLVFILS